MSKQLLYSIHASKIHKEVMNELKEKDIVLPGKSIQSIVHFIENSVKTKSNYDYKHPLIAGCAFPANVSVNENVAHYTYSDQNKDYILTQNDIVKIDFGVHRHGYIIDSAETFYFNEKYKEFIDISKKATEFAVRMSGVDKCLGDLGGEIEEYVHSKEVEIDNVTHSLYTLKELCGHNIGQYKIHNSKAVPNCQFDYPLRMEEGEVYALEPFVSTHSCESYYDRPCNLFMLNKDYLKHENKLTTIELEYFTKIKNQYNTLCFCDRWLKEELNDFNSNIINGLIHKNLIDEHENIYVPNGHYVSQFEKNIYINSNKVIELT